MPSALAFEGDVIVRFETRAEARETYFQRIEYLNITDCKDSTIYVTARLRYCLISGCEGTTMILGGVSTICTTHNCEKVNVHVAAHCYKMENCVDTSAYVYCHIPPIITGDTRGIQLAPYNVLHSHMASVLHGSQMTLEKDYVDIWAHPICCTSLALHTQPGTAGMVETLSSRAGTPLEPRNTTYHFVHPSKFFPVVVPESHGRSAPPQLLLPEVYDKAMKEQQDEVRRLMGQLRCLPSELAQKKAQESIHSHFKVATHKGIFNCRGPRIYTRAMRTKVKSADVVALPHETLVEALVPGVWGPLIDQFFQVRAHSTAGVGPWSASSDAMQVEPERPSKPDAPYKFELLPRAIVVFWRPSDSLGSDITGFGLRYAESRDMSRGCEVSGIKGTNTSFAVTNLQPSKSYYFQVRCINAIGVSDWSDPSSPVKVKQDSWRWPDEFPLLDGACADSEQAIQRTRPCSMAGVRRGG
ncbi:TBCCD1 [Symbiodinium natans]|uniref:TBCCD1 protein n=1 Tax=Symbiodinium natans TaxID=878477 RepID=A0A812QKA8_9DINO|nr:TBCCD1 [Symbiodinium natans]